MKTKLVFFLLFGTCAGIAFLWLNTPAPAGRAATAKTAEPGVAGPGASTQQASVLAQRAAVSQRAAETQATRTNAWAEIESEDLPRFVANLRNTGCPEDTVRDIATFRVARKYHARLLAAKARQAVVWQDLAHPPALAPASSNEDQLALRAAMDRELAAVLGADPEELKSIVTRGQHLYREEAFLPLNKQMRVREIGELYRRLSNEAREELQGAAEEDIQRKLRNLNQEKEAEIASILTPTEREEYELRYSKAAQYARSHIPEAKNEAEFREFVRAVNEAGVYETQPNLGVLARYGILNPLEKRDTAAEEEQARKQQLLRQRLKKSLGEQRYRELYPQEEAK